jgi:hypothetical protein
LLNLRRNFLTKKVWACQEPFLHGSKKNSRANRLEIIGKSSAC